jgi:hypothetical protein
MTSIDDILFKYKVLVERHANQFRPQANCLLHFISHQGSINKYESLRTRNRPARGRDGHISFLCVQTF